MVPASVPLLRGRPGKLSKFMTRFFLPLVGVYLPLVGGLFFFGGEVGWMFQCWGCLQGIGWGYHIRLSSGIGRSE